MRRVMRWLWRRFCQVAMLGVFLLTTATLLTLAPPRAAFAEPQRQVAAQQSMLSGGPPTPQERVREHARAQQGRRIYFGTLLYQIVLVGGFLLLGGTRWLARLVARLHTRWVWAVLAVFILVTLASALLTFPLEYYAGYLFPRQYGLTNQTPLAWLRDYLLGEGISLLVGLPLIALTYWLFRAAPRYWWLWLGAASVPVLIFMVMIEPVFIAPLFNKFTSLQDVQLRQEILTLAHQQGIKAHDVYQMDASRQSNAVNAYVNGFGPTQRIVLYDTLLRYFTPAEIKFVMAHEMGHYVLGHIRQGLVLAILGVFASGLLLQQLSAHILRRYGAFLGFRELGHPASLPLLLALGLALSIVAGPLGNAYSRHLEAEADRFAARIDPDYAAGIASFHKIARLNVAEENPPRWVVLLLYTHPSITQRIAELQADERAQGEQVTP